MKFSIFLLVSTIGVCSAIECDDGGCLTGELKKDGKKYNLTNLSGSPKECSAKTLVNCKTGIDACMAAEIKMNVKDDGKDLKGTVYINSCSQVAYDKVTEKDKTDTCNLITTGIKTNFNGTVDCKILLCKEGPRCRTGFLSVSMMLLLAAFLRYL